MPLMKKPMRKSEMQAKPDLAITLEMKKRNMRKMAEGGPIDDVKSSEIDVVRNKKKLDRLSNKIEAGEKGVHTSSERLRNHPKFGYSEKEHAGRSEAGHAILQDSEKYGAFAKNEHREKLEELKAMPKPKIQGLAHGGMAESSIIKPRLRSEIDAEMLRAQEAHLESSMPPEDETMEMPYDDEHAEHSDMFAKGGRVYERYEHQDAPTGPTGYKNRNRSSDMDHGQRKGPEGYGKYQEQAQNQKGIHTPVSGVTAFPGGKGSSEAGNLATETYAGKPHRELRDHGKELHKAKLEEMKAMPKPKLEGLAKGGEVEQEDEHHDSIAAAIMARRERKMYAEGGQVELDSHEDESEYNDQDEAALKEDYDSDIESIHEPEASNEHGDELSDEDAHDMISKIRAKMSKMRKG